MHESDLMVQGGGHIASRHTSLLQHSEHHMVSVNLYSMLQFIKFGSARWHLVVLTSLQAGPILYLGLAHGLQVRSDAVVSQPQIHLSN